MLDFIFDEVPRQLGAYVGIGRHGLKILQTAAMIAAKAIFREP